MLQDYTTTPSTVKCTSFCANNWYCSNTTHLNFLKKCRTSISALFKRPLLANGEYEIQQQNIHTMQGLTERTLRTNCSCSRHVLLQ